MEDSIFTKILKHEIPGEILYEDDMSFVILTIEPISPGHCLVVPKHQVNSLWELDNATYHHLFDVAQIMQQRLHAAYDYKRIGMFLEGFGVPHAHIHVLGLNEGIEPTILEHVAHKHQASAEELSEEAAKLRA